MKKSQHLRNSLKSQTLWQIQHPLPQPAARLSPIRACTCPCVRASANGQSSFFRWQPAAVQPTQQMRLQVFTFLSLTPKGVSLKTQPTLACLKIWAAPTNALVDGDRFLFRKKRCVVWQSSAVFEPGFPESTQDINTKFNPNHLKKLKDFQRRNFQNN